MTDFEIKYQNLIDNIVRDSVGVKVQDGYNEGQMCYECSYTNQSYYSTFLSKCTENYYCHRNINCENCFDCSDCGGTLNSYMCHNCLDCFECFNSQYCIDSKNLDHCLLCQGSEQCFGSYGLINEKFCIFNKKYSEEEYKNKIQELRKQPKEFIEAEEAKMYDKIGIMRTIDIADNSEDSIFTSEGISNKSCYYCFGTYQSKNSLYCFGCESADDSIDNTILVQSELCYGCTYSFTCNECFFCNDCMNCSRSSYLTSCYNCMDCFGCAQLDDKQYCILNKQYSKEEYFQKMVELKREMGWRV
jgi:hypothetical protein